MLKRRLQGGVGRIAAATGLRRLLRGRALIAVFHRIADELDGDPISCSAAEFRRYCRFFARHFDVIGLGELLDRLEAGAEVGGRLVITFDDGYRDNHEIAAPELARLGLPATFFIATDFIGTERVPEWDRKNGVRSRWMEWDQVRELAEDGFEVGAHTRGHVDLGTLGKEDAMQEIRGSKERLEEELGAEVRLFSYPFGGPDQITDEGRTAVREAGLRCCPSAFGGVVPPGADPFHLRRSPVTPWHISPYQWVIDAVRHGA